MSIVDKLPKEKLEECKMVFNLYDFKKQGILPIDLIEVLCKNLGAYVPTDDIKDLKENFSDGNINMDKFLEFFSEHYLKKIDKNQLINAIQFLDTGKSGKISTQELKHDLMVVGDKLTEKEVDELLKPFDKSGSIDYKSMATELAK